jgi:hypothetical protein
VTSSGLRFFHRAEIERIGNSTEWSARVLNLCLTHLFELAQMSSSRVTDAIEAYLRTGRYDPFFLAWPSGSIIECMKRGSRELQDALMDEVRRLAKGVTGEEIRLPEMDLVDFTRQKVEPMVRGLFMRKEVAPVLALLEKSVVFVTYRNVATRIATENLSTAWEIANIYLDSIGAERLDRSDQRIVGFSVDSTCYISMQYFTADDPFEDFVIHEVAHVFHNCKRRLIGLPETRTRQWLLPIDFRMRETFAYACEAYSQIVKQAKNAEQRCHLLEQLSRLPPPPDERVVPDEYFDVLAEAIDRRNGWKAILERCSTRPDRGKSKP